MCLDSKICRFPQEILVEILSRLPVKSLLKFRCVSKSWLSLICSPNFIKTHLQNSTKNRNITHHRIMLTFNKQFHCLFNDCSLYSLLFNSVSDAINIDFPMKIPMVYVRVVGSCNGLVCIELNGEDYTHLFLWNPTIRKAKQLRDSGMEMNLKVSLFQYGFGYDEANDDYKVVEIYSDIENEGVFGNIVTVYSLKTDSWKRIRDFEGYCRTNYGMIVNGKLHWLRSLSQGWTSASDIDIVSLDIETDLYGTIEQPNCPDSEVTLHVLGACLCVLRSNWTGGDLWILKEYGVKESWTKMVTIPYVVYLNMVTKMTPLYMLNNGEVLISFGTLFVVFNPIDRSLRYPIINLFSYCLDPKIYVESLVSPIADDGLVGQH